MPVDTPVCSPKMAVHLVMPPRLRLVRVAPNAAPFLNLKNAKGSKLLLAFSNSA
jgi:hypothetical protein